MTDSPTKKKRFGVGICWDYMDKGACTCNRERAQVAGWHPKLSVSAITTTTSGVGDATASVVVSMPERIPEWIESLKYLDFLEGDLNNSAILNAGYDEREEVKSLGAIFDPGMKKWIVLQGQDLEPFAKWKPRIKNRRVGEVVMHNQYFDIASTVRELQRCGVRPSHFDILGSDSEAENLRKELTDMQKKRTRTSSGDTNRKKGSCVIDLCYGDTEKSKPDPHYQRATTPDDSDEHANASSPKRLRFSTPESLQTFVRRKQNEQIGGERQGHEEVSEFNTEEGGGHQNELSALLSTAKSAQVRCNSAGGVSAEQKQFNEAISNVVEALAANLNSEKGNKSPRHHDHSRKQMVTPTIQRMRASGKTPGVSGTW